MFEVVTATPWSDNGNDTIFGRGCNKQQVSSHKNQNLYDTIIHFKTWLCSGEILLQYQLSQRSYCYQEFWCWSCRWSSQSHLSLSNLSSPLGNPQVLLFILSLSVYVWTFFSLTFLSNSGFVSDSSRKCGHILSLWNDRRFNKRSVCSKELGE